VLIHLHFYSLHSLLERFPLQTGYVRLREMGVQSRLVFKTWGVRIFENARAAIQENVSSIPTVQNELFTVIVVVYFEDDTTRFIFLYFFDQIAQLAFTLSYQVSAMYPPGYTDSEYVHDQQGSRTVTGSLTKSLEPSFGTIYVIKAIMFNVV
jgi:hypothetical protein